jgi:hypothetical protein
MLQSRLLARSLWMSDAQGDAVPPHSRLYPLIGFVWFLAALVAGASGWLSRLAPPRPQLLLAALTAVLMIAGIVVPSFRSWLAGVDLRTVIALHFSRFIGVYFLVLYARGLLPFPFAVVGGWGDIAIAATALAWLVLTRDPAGHRSLLRLWNLCGLIDTFFVVATAARMGLADPASMGPLRTLPLSLLPTFLVPLIIASHILIFWRLSLAPRRKR